MVFDDAPTITYTVRYSDEIPFDREWMGCSEFTLKLIADDPYGYAEQDTTSGSITASGGAVTVTSGGNVATPARMSITNNGAAPVTGFMITIQYQKGD